MATNCFWGLYYMVLIAYCFYYLVASFQLIVPWSTCHNWWNTALCTDQKTLANLTRTELSLMKNMTSSPSEEYFYRRVLQISGGVEHTDGLVVGLVVALAIAWLICFLALSKGVQSLGKVAYFTALFPYVMLTVLIIRGATLSGSVEGIKFYMGTVNFSVLKNPSVWKDACTQVFYALSCCSGGLIAMASFNDFNNNIYRDTIAICCVTWFTSIFSGFAIFTVLGHMATKMGVSVADVAKGGPGLAFVVFPEGLSMMPFAPLWCVLFFLMMCTLGFGSEFSIMETVMASIIDEFKMYLNTPKKIVLFRFGLSVVFFLVGLSMVTRGGLYVLNIVDQYLGGFPWLIIGVVELFCIAWVYGTVQLNSLDFHIYFIVCIILGMDNFCDDIAIMLGEERRPNVTLDDYAYPTWALALGWMVVIICLGWLPYMFFVEICRRGTWGIIKEARFPHPNWGPARNEHRELSRRYTKCIQTKTLSMQTLTTIADVDKCKVSTTTF
ncbi:unnamed protein product [Adineta ricciae]|uniref:Uncharacterized protein n=1 Tax=Adineta ricciae TaxID=249248 RepID=A0A815NZ76_ADIRI|nr:unnamed protein product [Adineta ricciae]